jgi:hypothetical protein
MTPRADVKGEARGPGDFLPPADPSLPVHVDLARMHGVEAEADEWLLLFRGLSLN